MNEERLLKILIAPRISEKSTLASELGRQYVFKVIPSAKKPDIKQAVELIFKVVVDSVRTINVRGKGKAFRGRFGSRPSWKKAYVKLKEGHEIDVMGGQ
jgi:large subunit ribosomal protein L23